MGPTRQMQTQGEVGLMLCMLVLLGLVGTNISSFLKVQVFCWLLMLRLSFGGPSSCPLIVLSRGIGSPELFPGNVSSYGSCEQHGCVSWLP